VIERPRQRNHSPARHPSMRRLQSHAAAQRRRLANRPRRVSPNRRISQTSGHRRSRPSRRSARDAPNIPRIVHIPKVADQRTPAISELVQIIFSDDDRPRVPQSPNQFRVVRRDAVRTQRARRRRTHSRHVDQILQRHRNPMQRPPPLPAQNLSLGPPRLRQRRLSHHRNERIERRVQSLDALQALPRNLHRRNFPPTQLSAQLRNRNQVSHCHVDTAEPIVKPQRSPDWSSLRNDFCKWESHQRPRGKIQMRA